MPFRLFSSCIVHVLRESEGIYYIMVKCLSLQLFDSAYQIPILYKALF